jgi:hypothetical protein
MTALDISLVKAVRSKVIPLVKTVKRQLATSNTYSQWQSFDNSENGPSGEDDTGCIIELAQSTDSTDRKHNKIIR